MVCFPMLFWKLCKDRYTCLDFQLIQRPSDFIFIIIGGFVCHYQEESAGQYHCLPLHLPLPLTIEDSQGCRSNPVNYLPYLIYNMLSSHNSQAFMLPSQI